MSGKGHDAARRHRSKLHWWNRGRADVFYARMVEGWIRPEDALNAAESVSIDSHDLQHAQARAEAYGAES